MADPSALDPAALDAWRSDPQADYLAFQLIRLAHIVISIHFDSEEPERAYADWLRRELRRKGGGRPKLLREWDEDPDRPTLSLTAQPVASTFTVVVAHADLTAEITILYDVEREELTSGTIRHFQGSVAQAIESANSWFDELTDVDFEDENLQQMLLDSMASVEGKDIDMDVDVDFDADVDDDVDDDDAEIEGPPDLSPNDRRRLDRMARSLSRRAKAGTPPLIGEADQEWLDEHPQALDSLLDGATVAALTTPRDDKLFAAWLAMLTYELEHIRYQSDRGRDWAIAMLDEYQDRLIALAKELTLSPDHMVPLVAALRHAKVPVTPELSEALMGDDIPLPAELASDDLLEAGVRPLLDELARTISTPYELMDAMGETTAVMPAALRCFIAHELAQSPHAVMQEAVPLLLLDADVEVRRAAALALDQTAEKLPPVSLRRAIALRNWIPEADRATLDQAIRKARTKGVQPAQWSAAPDIVLRASTIDGSGAQSMVLLGRTGKVALFGGLLLKQGFGIRDAWCSPGTPRRDIGSAVAELQRQVVAPEIEHSYIDLAVQHGIALGVAAGNLPEPDLLQLAEAAGGADWKDRLLDADAETERLFSALPAEQRTASAIAASLRRSGAWIDAAAVSYSWFEDDAEMRQATAASARSDVEAAARRLLDGMLEQRRGVWGERFLLTALWARAVKPGQPPPLGVKGHSVTWQDMLVLAHAVLSGRKLREIPVMETIAQRTVVGARSAKW